MISREPEDSADAERSRLNVSPSGIFVVRWMPAVRPSSTGAGAARTGTAVAAKPARPTLVMRLLRMGRSWDRAFGTWTCRGRPAAVGGSPEPFAELLRLRPGMAVSGGVMVAEVGPLELAGHPRHTAAGHGLP